jgi:hypothetical protein
MRTIILAIYFLISLAQAQNPLTNSDVIHLVQSGISPLIVKATISKSKTGFDMTPDGLIQLKKAGMNDDIVMAMLSKNNVVPGTAIISLKDSLENLPGGIYYRSPDKYISLVPGFLTSAVSKGLAGTIKKAFTGFIPFIVKASVAGAHGSIRISEKKPVLLFMLDYPARHPEEFFLVRLRTSDSSRQISFAKPVNGSGPILLNDSLKIDFSIKKSANGSYEVSPDHPLMPGEYGFIYSAAALYSGTRYKIYNFSITEK